MTLEINNIYNEDCIEGMKKLDANSCHLAILDPPYGMSYKSNYGSKFKEIKNDNNLDWVEDVFSELNRVTVDDSHIYCYTSVEYMDVFLKEIKKYWKVKNIITVPRTMKGGLGDLYSSYSPQKEFIIFGTKGKRKFEETQILKPSEVYLKDKRKKPKEWIYRLPDEWNWVKVSEHNLKRVHPTQKTVETVDIMIKMSSKEGEVVIDPFMGSGTTAIASVEVNRNYIGFELDEEYHIKANERIKSHKQELVINKLR